MANHLIHLLRHGQFLPHEGSNDGPLTAVGRRQARRTATRMRESNIARVYSSDLERSRETAAIIATRLDDMRVTSLPMLRECIPTGVPGRRVPLAKRRLGQQRVEELIARFLSKPPRAGNTLVVCHGNLIRAVLCRVLGSPLSHWHRLGILHCGITTFGFRQPGVVGVRCFNDSGHLPMGLQTTQ